MKDKCIYQRKWLKPPTRNPQASMPGQAAIVSELGDEECHVGAAAPAWRVTTKTIGHPFFCLFFLPTTKSTNHPLNVPDPVTSTMKR